jgi:hypothetical protein
MIEELGQGYVWHSYISMTIGGLLNVCGIFMRFSKPKK